jgi:hypothetical protein
LRKIYNFIICIILVIIIASSSSLQHTELYSTEKEDLNYKSRYVPLAQDTVLATPTTSPVPVSPFYTEEFDALLPGWESIHFTNANNDKYESLTVMGIENGSLNINISLPKTYVYYMNNTYNYDNVKLEAEFTNSGVDSNYVSLVCRYDPYLGWYEFTVSNSGQVAILHYSKEKDFIVLGAGGAQNINNRDSDIKTNKITAMCNDDMLTLLVNDVEWRTFRDDSIQRGRVGVSVGSENVYPVDTSINNFIVSAMPDTITTLANNTYPKIIPITDCKDWWDCASKTPMPDDPRFHGWARMGGVSGNQSDPWYQKRGWINENEWREERTRIIWDYLCQIHGCPSEKELSAYLLYQEGSVLLDDEYALEIMIKAFKFKFSTDNFIGLYDVVYSGDGITISDLSFFTPFFNPEDDGASFTEADWNMLTTKPAQIYIRQIDKWWDDEPYPICGTNNEVVEHWWTRGEKAAGNWVIYYEAYDSNGFIIMGFGS